MRHRRNTYAQTPFLPIHVLWDESISSVLFNSTFRNNEIKGKYI